MARLPRTMFAFALLFWVSFSAQGQLSQSSYHGSDDEDGAGQVEEVVVSGLRATQGGAQDINFFRGAVEEDRIPHPNDLTAEGLFSEHDIVLAQDAVCRQLFCLTGEALAADLIAAPEARYLIGIGFTSNIESAAWQREPLNLVAVVDKSGSMDGKPLDLVRKSLREIAKQLKPQDQLSIVLYGDTSHVHLAPTPVSGSKRRILESIREIHSAGSTAMEAGLRLGYRVAYDTAPQFKGATRLMLFTDERPNVGATDPESFMGMATAASKRGVGLTTIGVGVQFGAELATKISSVRGGNLFFIRDEDDVRSVYADQLDYMVSELAHDLQLTLAPQPNYRIAGVYGIPGTLMNWQEDTVVQVRIPTVFLSNRGGAIFLALAPDTNSAFLPERTLAPNEALAEIAVTYQLASKATSETQAHRITIAPPADQPTSGMQLGHLLVDEFTVLHKATAAHYLRNDQETAYQLLRAYSGRLEQATAPGLDKERELVATLEDKFAFLSGHTSELARKRNFAQLWGTWRIERVYGGTDLRRGELLEFTPDNTLRVYDKGAEDPREEESYESNNEQVYLHESELVFHYNVSDKSLKLHHRRTGLRVRLTRTS